MLFNHYITAHRITAISVDKLIHEAVDAFERGELDESKIKAEVNVYEEAPVETKVSIDSYSI